MYRKNPLYRRASHGEQRGQICETKSLTEATGQRGDGGVTGHQHQAHIKCPRTNGKIFLSLQIFRTKHRQYNAVNQMALNECGA